MVEQRQIAFALTAVASAITATQTTAFAPSPTRRGIIRSNVVSCSETATDGGDGDGGIIASVFDDAKSASSTSSGFRRARDLTLSLINDENCFSTVEGTATFAESCAVDVVFEDCYLPQPVVGRVAVGNYLREKVSARKGGPSGSRDAGFRIDRISDGSAACGFAWTWTSSTLEGLRGTTFLSLNDAGQIQYVREIPEPIYKPGDLTIDLLKAVTAGSEPAPKVEFVPRSPRVANEVARYLFEEVQGSSIDEAMRFFGEGIVYRDFNYEEVLRGKVEVRKFIEDFSFPGITFAPQRFDDGVAATCFTWEVVLEGAPEDGAIKGISFYEVDQESGVITYVRDVPESAIKPPILGKLARQLRPALGVFDPVDVGSREGGM